MIKATIAMKVAHITSLVLPNKLLSHTDRHIQISWCTDRYTFTFTCCYTHVPFHFALESWAQQRLKENSWKSGVRLG